MKTKNTQKPSIPSLSAKLSTKLVSTQTQIKQLNIHKLAFLYTKNSLRIYRIVMAVVLISASVAIGSRLVLALGSHPASNVIGQSVFTNGRSNRATVNDSGLNDPNGSVFDSTNNRLFVSDSNNSRVLVYNTTSGITDGMPASYVLGQPDFVSFIRATTQSGMSAPDDVTYDSTNNRLFVADQLNSRVLVYDLSSGITNGMAASYVIGQAGFNSSFSTLSQDGMYYPYAITYDSTNYRLFVADLYRVTVYDLSSGITNGMTASYVLGQPGFVGGQCLAYNATSSTTCYIKGVSYDPANARLFVADQTNNRVLVYDLTSGITNGMAASYVLGQPDFVSYWANDGTNVSSTGLYNPGRLVFDSTNHRLFVADYSNNRVLVYDLTSGITNGMPASYVLGQPDFVSNTCVPTQTSMCYPYGLTYDSTNNRLFVADGSNNRVLVYDLIAGITNGISATNVLGQTNFNGSSPDHESVTANGLNYPQASTYDSLHHRLFVADTNNNRVLVYNTTSGVADGMSASYVLGQPDMTSSSCNTGNVTASNMCYPSAVAYDFVNDRLFVSTADYNNRVLVYDLTPGITNGMAASYVLGQPDFVSSGCTTTQSGMCSPYYGLNYNSTDKRLFVADQGNQRVLVYDLTSGITNGMAASHVLGQPDFVSNTFNNGGITDTSFADPAGITYDSANHRLFIAQQSANRVLVYDLSSGITNGMAASYVLGQPDFGSNSSNYNGVTSSSMNYPWDVAYNPTNKHLFVTDSSNNRVLVYDLTSGITNGMPAGDVLGQPDFVTNDCVNNPAIQSGMCYPSGLTYDSTNSRLFVADTNSNRILTFDNLIFPFTITSSQLQSGQVRASYSSPILTAFGTGPLSFAITSGSLPSGLSLSRSTGAITGVPTTAGTYNFTVEATDSMNATSTASFSINIIAYAYVASNILGQPGFASTACNSIGLTARGLCSPTGQTYDSTHNRLFVADTSNGRVLVYDLTSGITNGMAASYVLGQPDFVTIVGNITQTGMGDPYGLTYDSAHNRLFVSEYFNSRVLVYDLTSGITNGMAASYVLGQPDFVSSTCVRFPSTQAGMCYASGLTYDSAHNRLLVADNYNGRVLVYDLTSGITNGMAASYVLGQPDFVIDICSTTQTGMCTPSNLSYDYAGNRLFVADQNNSRVLVYDLTSGITNGMAASYVLGQPDFVTNTCVSPTTQTGICGVSGLTYESTSHRLLVADYNNNRVLVYDLSSGITNGMTASYVLGQPDFVSNTCKPVGATSSGMCQPYGDLVYDLVNKRLFTVDQGNHRILIFNFVRITTASVSSATVGSAYSQPIATAGSQGTLSYSLASGVLPLGMSLNSITGILSGTPTTTGTYNFSVKITDNNGDIGVYTDTKSYSLQVTSTPSTPPSSTPPATTVKKTIKSLAVVPSILDTDSTLYTSIGITINNLVVGDKQLFCLINPTNDQVSDSRCSNKAESHTITVSNIDTDKNIVTVTVASTPQTISLALRQTKAVDVDLDGNVDIQLTLNSITPATESSSAIASITVKALTSAEAVVVSNIASPTDSIPQAKPGYSLLQKIIAFSIVALLLAVIYRIDSRAHRP